jgi:hypothetical protein
MVLREANSPRGFGNIKETKNEIAFSNLLAGSQICREFASPCRDITNDDACLGKRKQAVIGMSISNKYLPLAKQRTIRHKFPM